MATENSAETSAPQTTRTREVQDADAEKVTISLKRPITVSGVKTSSIVMRRPKVRDQIAAQDVVGNDAEKESRFIGNLCGLAPEEIADVDLFDFRKLQQQVSVFVGAPLTK